jgi:hypothetical protein
MTLSERILGALLAFSLCFGVATAAEPPDAQMTSASLAISAAARLEPQGPAADLLAQARQRYGLASEAIGRRKYKDAIRLADEARAIADQASARARLGNARAEVEEKQGRNADLRRQLQMQSETRQ